MGEVWKPVAGYEGLYEVSNFGNVRSLFRYKKQLKPYENARGYKTVELAKDKTRKRVFVHRLVAAAFIENLNNLPQVNHIDENPRNNCADNLEWCSAKYNMNYGEGAKTRHAKINYSNPIFAKTARINGAKTSRPVLQYTMDGVLISRYISGKDAHRATGINHSHILECCAGKRYKTVGGYVWKYEERNDDLLVSQS